MLLTEINWSERVKAFWAADKEIVLSRSTIATLCAACAQKMESLGITSLHLKANSVPPEMIQGLCDSLGGAEGFFDRCVSHDFGDFHPDDKEAFCAWLHNECLGKFPSQALPSANISDSYRDEEQEALYRYKKGLEPAPLIYRNTGHIKVNPSSSGNDQPMVFVASEESEDRLGDLIAADGWITDSYKANPVFLWMHDQSIPPIGSMAKVWNEGKQLLASPKWDDQDEFASLIKGKYQRGFLKAVSVGFRVLEFDERENSKGRWGFHSKKQELVEISAVPVPAHPKTLQKLGLGERHFYFIGDLLKDDINSLRSNLEHIERLLDESKPKIAGQSIADAIRTHWIGR